MVRHALSHGSRKQRSAVFLTLLFFVGHAWSVRLNRNTRPLVANVLTGLLKSGEGSEGENISDVFVTSMYLQRCHESSQHLSSLELLLSRKLKSTLTEEQILEEELSQCEESLRLLAYTKKNAQLNLNDIQAQCRRLSIEKLAISDEKRKILNSISWVEKITLPAPSNCEHFFHPMRLRASNRGIILDDIEEYETQLSSAVSHLYKKFIKDLSQNSAIKVEADSAKRLSKLTFSALFNMIIRKNITRMPSNKSGIAISTLQFRADKLHTFEKTARSHMLSLSQTIAAEHELARELTQVQTELKLCKKVISRLRTSVHDFENIKLTQMTNNVSTKGQESMKMFQIHLRKLHQHSLQANNSLTAAISNLTTMENQKRRLEKHLAAIRSFHVSELFASKAANAVLVEKAKKYIIQLSQFFNASLSSYLINDRLAQLKRSEISLKATQSTQEAGWSKLQSELFFGTKNKFKLKTKLLSDLLLSAKLHSVLSNSRGGYSSSNASAGSLSMYAEKYTRAKEIARSSLKRLKEATKHLWKLKEKEMLTNISLTDQIGATNSIKKATFLSEKISVLHNLRTLVPIQKELENWKARTSSVGRKAEQLQMIEHGTYENISTEERTSKQIVDSEIAKFAMSNAIQMEALDKMSLYKDLGDSSRQQENHFPRMTNGTKSIASLKNPFRFQFPVAKNVQNEMNDVKESTSIIRTHNVNPTLDVQKQMGTIYSTAKSMQSRRGRQQEHMTTPLEMSVRNAWLNLYRHQESVYVARRKYLRARVNQDIEAVEVEQSVLRKLQSIVSKERTEFPTRADIYINITGVKSSFLDAWKKLEIAYSLAKVLQISPHAVETVIGDSLSLKVRVGLMGKDTMHTLFNVGLKDVVQYLTSKFRWPGTTSIHLVNIKPVQEVATRSMKNQIENYWESMGNVFKLIEGSQRELRRKAWLAYLKGRTNVLNANVDAIGSTKSLVKLVSEQGGLDKLLFRKWLSPSSDFSKNLRGKLMAKLSSQSQVHDVSGQYTRLLGDFQREGNVNANEGHKEERENSVDFKLLSHKNHILSHDLDMRDMDLVIMKREKAKLLQTLKKSNEVHLRMRQQQGELAKLVAEITKNRSETGISHFVHATSNTTRNERRGDHIVALREGKTISNLRRLISHMGLKRMDEISSLKQGLNSMVHGSSKILQSMLKTIIRRLNVSTVQRLDTDRNILETIGMKLHTGPTASNMQHFRAYLNNKTVEILGLKNRNLENKKMYLFETRQLRSNYHQRIRKLEAKFEDLRNRVKHQDALFRVEIEHRYNQKLNALVGKYTLNGAALSGSSRASERVAQYNTAIKDGLAKFEVADVSNHICNLALRSPDKKENKMFLLSACRRAQVSTSSAIKILRNVLHLGDQLHELAPTHSHRLNFGIEMKVPTLNSTRKSTAFAASIIDADERSAVQRLNRAAERLGVAKIDIRELMYLFPQLDSSQTTHKNLFSDMLNSSGHLGNLNILKVILRQYKNVLQTAARNFDIVNQETKNVFTHGDQSLRTEAMAAAQEEREPMKNNTLVRYMYDSSRLQLNMVTSKAKLAFLKKRVLQRLEGDEMREKMRSELVKMGAKLAEEETTYATLEKQIANMIHLRSSSIQRKVSEMIAVILNASDHRVHEVGTLEAMVARYPEAVAKLGSQECSALVPLKCDGGYCCSTEFPVCGGEGTCPRGKCCSQGPILQPSSHTLNTTIIRLDPPKTRLSLMEAKEDALIKLRNAASMVQINEDAYKSLNRMLTESAKNKTIIQQRLASTTEYLDVLNNKYHVSTKKVRKQFELLVSIAEMQSRNRSVANWNNLKFAKNTLFRLLSNHRSILSDILGMSSSSTLYKRLLTRVYSIVQKKDVDNANEKRARSLIRVKELEQYVHNLEMEIQSLEMNETDMKEWNALK